MQFRGRHPMERTWRRGAQISVFNSGDLDSVCGIRVTTPMAKARGFSVLPHGFCRESLKAVPPPLNVLCSVFVSVQDQPTGGTDMGPHGETLLDSCPTAAAVLTGVRWWNRYHSTASICCFAVEDQAEGIPPSILNRLIEARLLAGSI